MNKDRFDLENEIMNLYSTVTDLEAVADTLYDSKKKYTEEMNSTPHCVDLLMYWMLRSFDLRMYSVRYLNSMNTHLKK
jgi:hypothetical protein